MAKGIYKRGNIYWIRYAGIDCRTVRESSGSTKYRDAERLLISRKSDISEGKQPEIKRIANHAFRELAEQYLKWAERQRCLRSKQGFIRQFLEVFDSYPLRRFNSMMVEQYQTDRLNKGNRPATVNRHIATLKHMFRKAVEWEMVEEEILKKIRRVKLLPENNRRLRYLSAEECRELIDACDPHLRPIVVMALNTGMRKGEILSLKWDNVDLRHGFILLDRTKNGERREIPINHTLRSVFQELIRRLDVEHVFFQPTTGKPYMDLKKSFAKALRRVKIQDFRFHNLRHTFASHLVMAGVDITTVKELLGHKTLAMTLRYAHLAPAHKMKAVELLDSILFNSTAQLLHNQADTIRKRGTVNAATP